MKIGDFDVGKKVLIIAEIGNNHEGHYSLAEEMIGLASEAGADAVKFQTIIPEKLVSVEQKDRIDQLKRFQFSYEQFESLSLLANSHGLIFLSTPFDIDSAIFLDNIVPAYKIASSDNNFFPLIKVISEIGKPILLSTGLMCLEEVKQTLAYIQKIWDSNNIEQHVALLHCVSSYPTPTDQANLLAMRELSGLSPIVGYSDHTLGTDAAVLSVALGARIIEKHFTIDKNFSNFRDHQLSADPRELRALVEKVRSATTYMGTGLKVCQKNEVANHEPLRRSIVAKRFLTKNTILIWDDLEWVRPGFGVSPGAEHSLLGKTLKQDIMAGELITLDKLN